MLRSVTVATRELALALTSAAPPLPSSALLLSRLALARWLTRARISCCSAASSNSTRELVQARSALSDLCPRPSASALDIPVLNPYAHTHTRTHISLSPRARVLTQDSLRHASSVSLFFIFAMNINRAERLFHVTQTVHLSFCIFLKYSSLCALYNCT